MTRAIAIFFAGRIYAPNQTLRQFFMNRIPHLMPLRNKRQHHYNAAVLDHIQPVSVSNFHIATLKSLNRLCTNTSSLRRRNIHLRSGISTYSVQLHSTQTPQMTCSINRLFLKPGDRQRYTLNIRVPRQAASHIRLP
jgi:hypothetical protein